MRVRVTFEFDDTERRALARWHGEQKPMSHDDLRNWIRGVIETELADIVVEYEHESEPRA